MSKIVLNPITGGFNLSQINNNFSKIAEELNDKVLYRNSPVGEANQMSTPLDMNGQPIYNLPAPTSPGEPVRLGDADMFKGEKGDQGDKGDPGIPGIQGPRGFQGIQGVQGIQGIQGPQGSQGPQGVDGRGVNILGSYSTLLELETAHPTGVVGDAYMVGPNLYVWVSGAGWSNVGNIQGPQGIQGIQGSQGLQGVQGVQGIEGPEGPQGLPGERGTPANLGEYRVGLIAEDRTQILIKDGILYRVSNTTAIPYTFTGVWSTDGPNVVPVDAAVELINYTELRAYTGASRSVTITAKGIFGHFYKDALDTISVDNDGTIIVSSEGIRWKRQYSGDVDPRWFNAVGDGIANDTAAIQKAINFASSVKQAVRITGKYAIDGDNSVPTTGMVIYGKDRRSDGFILRPQPSSISGGSHGYFITNPTENVTGVVFDTLGFWGGYNSATWTSSMVFPVFQSAPGAGIVHDDFRFTNLLFQDLSFHGIYLAPQDTGVVRNVEINGCRGDVTALATSSRFSNLYQGIIGWIDYPGHVTSYGNRQIQKVRVTNCSARGMRTLADMKRGHSDFIVDNCFTIDMSDCHYSIDGSFNGKFTNLVGSQSSNQLPNKNFIEIQGEDIEVSSFSYKGTRALGSVAGILLTTYAYPQESLTATHQCKRVVIHSGELSGIDQNAIRLQDTIDCSVENVKLSDIQFAAVSIESPTTTENGGVNAAYPSGNMIDRITGGSGVGTYGVNIHTKATRTTVGRVKGFLGITTGSVNFTALHKSNVIVDPTLQVINSACAWFSATAGVTVADSAIAPIGETNSTLITGASTTVLSQLRAKSYLPVLPAESGTSSVGETVAVRCKVRLGTASSAGILFQEVDAAGNFLQNDFQGIAGVNSANFTEAVLYHSVTNPLCRFVQVSLLPTTDFASPATGSSYWSGVVITKETA